MTIPGAVFFRPNEAPRQIDRYLPRGGPLGRLAAPLIDKMLMGTFTDMLAATDEAARADGSER